MKELFAQVMQRMKAWGPDRWLVAGLSVLSALILVQVIRYGATHVSAWCLTRALKDTTQAPPKRDEIKLAAFDPVLSKGLFGEASPENGDQKPSVFGIMGHTALIGMSPGDAQPFKVDAEVPGGEKLVRIGVDEVDFEKDGEKRTVKVFSGQPIPSSPGGPPGAAPPQGGGTPSPGGGPPGAPSPGGEPPKGSEMKQGQPPPGTVPGGPPEPPKP